MLLGDVCTRGCRFCAVTTGDPGGAVDTREPEHVARAIASLELQYVVLTMVNRDDLLDGGADHVGRTVKKLRELRSDILIETLVGDFAGKGDSIADAARANPDVFAHNVETVPRLQRQVRDVRASFERSIEVLSIAKRGARELATTPGARPMLTKSSIMVGLGETDDEVIETMRLLREADVDVVTLGQYLRPSPKYLEVQRFVEPSTFAEYEAEAKKMGFLYAASGPLVRSSYKAAEVFLKSLLGTDDVAEPRDASQSRREAALDARLARARDEARRVASEVTAAKPKSDLIPVSSLIRR
jgi:lipoic acid synthetase